MTDSEEFLANLVGIVSIIPTQYVDALLVLHEKLDNSGIRWAVNGDLALSLKTIDIEPDGIEIVTSQADAEAIFNAVSDYNPQPIYLQTQKLSRNAIFLGQEYPVYIRSYHFEFIVKGLNVKVDGDLQYKVGDWEWGDVFEFNPDYVNVVGKETAVAPMMVLYELYASLGWMEKAEKISGVLQKRFLMKKR